MKTIIRKTICPKCEGNGEHKERMDGVSIFLAPFCFGLSLPRDMVECRICKGKGYIMEKCIEN